MIFVPRSLVHFFLLRVIIMYLFSKQNGQNETNIKKEGQI
jgi:hypothetical protein